MMKYVGYRFGPVKAKLVADPVHYLYSSVSNYETGEGLLEVEVIPSNEVGYVIL